MPTINLHLSAPLPRTFRAMQLAGLFDVPLSDRIVHTLTVDVPGLDEAWTIGAIVGPSGSGKTTLARAAFGEIHRPAAWPADLPIIECLDGAWRAGGESLPMALSMKSPQLPEQPHRPAHAGRSPGEVGRPEARPTIKQLARLLTAVGLGSVRTWLKPYQVLSTGERFRADVARAVLQASGRREPHDGLESPNDLACGKAPSASSHWPLAGGAKPLVLDEFTSSLDRTLARTASAALSRLLRRVGAPRLVALTSHDDILPWLAPDWVVDLGGSVPRLIRCQPQPLELSLRIGRVPQSLWRDFAGQHYLTGGLAASATCYAAWIDSPVAARGPVAFCAAVAALGWKRTKRITRLVVRPEFQGLGIGTRLAESVAAIESRQGHRVTITASHPAIVGHCSRSPRWRLLGLKKTGSTPQRYAGRDIRCSTGRAVASFEYLLG